MRLIFRQILRSAVLAAGLFALAACSRMGEVGFDTKMALGSVSMVDRCSDFMSRAFPNGDIDVVGSHVAADAQSTLVTVQGVRSGISEKAPGARSVAVECHYQNGVLTSFRWIAGPIRPATIGQAPQNRQSGVAAGI
jgi:hypothetical protein